MVRQRISAMKSQSDVIAKIDRVVVYSGADLHSALSALPQFKTLWDCRPVHPEGGPNWGAYRRARQLLNRESATKIIINYDPRHRWLMPMLKMEISPDDRSGMQRRELEAILRAIVPFRLAAVEVAVDFAAKTR